MPRRAIALVSAVVLAVAMTVGGVLTVSAYIDQSQIQILLTGPGGPVKCNRGATVTATVVSTQDGKPVRNQIVRWSLARTQSGGDGLSATSTVTNRRGKTTVKVFFGPVAGPRTVQAAANVVAPKITVRCAGGLPRTAPLPRTDQPEPPSAALLAPPAAEAPMPAGPLPAHAIRLDRLGMDVPLVEGDGVTVPDQAIAHYPGTAWPDGGSNTYLYGHARPGQFLELWRVRTGDHIELDMADGGVAGYRVTEIHPVVAWDALEYLHPTSTERLTLQTCLTYDDTAPRFIVIAERVPDA